MSQFTFLQREWAAVFEAASKAEAAVHADPRTACFYARRALELAVSWAYKHDAALRLPYQDNLSALIHEPSFKQTAGEAVFSKARVINTLGNRAVHSHRPVPEADALAAVRELFHVALLVRAHLRTRRERPAPGLAFDPAALPRPARVGKQTAEQLQALEARLRERDEKPRGAAGRQDRARRGAEAPARRGRQGEEGGCGAARHPRLLRSRDPRLLHRPAAQGSRLAARPAARPRVRGQRACPTPKGKGFVDYVLWGDDGKPLGLVEAKRTRRDARGRAAAGQALRRLPGAAVRPAAGHLLLQRLRALDLGRHALPAAPGAGLLQEGGAGAADPAARRRAGRSAEAPINEKIVERYYQTRAIRRIAEAFERDHDRKALLVMATGAGKTRTVIALCDLLMRCNWAKRVLFLADRVALVNQAVNAFKRHLPDASPVNLVTEKDAEGRVYVSTYPTMMGLIDEAPDGQRRFGVGHFDLVIIDEAHRSVFQKYRAIFDYFDSLLVGLTATPKDEVDRNTYSLFDLENGVPTDAYSLEEAVRDGFLVPPKAVSVPLKFQREGIKYDELSEEDKDQWDALEWDDDGNVPDRVEAEAVNKWLFNKDTVDKVLEHLMTRGLKVAGGDRLGKTIIFAKNQHHAEFIAERFDANYPHYKGEFARVITFKTEYAQSLIDDFSIKEKAPHIAISVDMLDTGHRRAGGREPRLLQARALQDQVLADGRARHAALPGPVRPGAGQGVLLRLRLLPEPRVLQPGHPGHRGLVGRVARQAALRRTAGADRSAG